MRVSRRGFLFLGCAAVAPGWARRSGEDVRVVQIFDKINGIRRLHGLAELAWNERVAAAATAHAANMARRKFFSHDDPLLGDLCARLGRAGIGWSCCAENLFQEQGYRDLAAIAVESWKASPGHLKNILNARATQTGIGLATATDGSNWLDQIFIRP